MRRYMHWRAAARQLGTRRGFLLIMLWWSIACALHGFASGFALAAGDALFAGHGGGWSISGGDARRGRVDFPRTSVNRDGHHQCRHRCGVRSGPPLIGVVLMHLRDGAGFSSPPEQSAGLGSLVGSFLSRQFGNALGRHAGCRLLARRLSFGEIFGIRNVQALVFAKFMSDSAWYFLLFWLPKYLYDARGFDIKQVSYYAWIPYAASGIGSFLGGCLSSRLLRSGHSLDRSRKIVLGINAAFMPAVMLVPLVPVSYALALFSVAFFCQQSWSGIIMTVPADIFPLSAVGTVAGLVGFGGSIGGAIFGVDRRMLAPAMDSAMERSSFWSGHFTLSDFLPWFSSAAGFNHFDPKI